MFNLKSDLLPSIREITHSSTTLEGIVAGYTDRPTPEDLARLAGHAAQMERTWTDFRKACEQAAADYSSFTWE